MKWQDEEYFGGLRERVLERDGYKCRVCGKPAVHGKKLMVHHRRPGVSIMRLMITLCRGCHSKVHKRKMMIGVDIPELLRVLWRELHAGGAEQFSMDFSPLGAEAVNGSLLE